MASLTRIREILIEWQSKQGHDQCWYYPELFRRLCEELDVECRQPELPREKAEFDRGCDTFSDEVYRCDNCGNVKFDAMYCGDCGWTPRIGEDS